ncbi:uncharacterized protein AMSG_05483 [Thecamonas trahens ATCC 50062]|uniref:Uncharacterized protein n=1 Tax=Thecamonas trahens ATCC 50062 TaxID=461836 RepID=A0A0L0DB49_THETB|nr:hypothetical protein AMSG_05483 [Thecamonas trahens ATCC 50062]KNC49470.1 hypothetical protein AMSG_05483 [Thecamonas trahens ATCC 50062]|eukprot:XP_013757889.1 hypothetical protein AMSG_05483 [Thecamonas trahens ATCC 50062]
MSGKRRKPTRSEMLAMSSGGGGEEGSGGAGVAAGGQVGSPGGRPLVGGSVAASAAPGSGYGPGAGALGAAPPPMAMAPAPGTGPLAASDASFVGTHGLRLQQANDSNWPLRTPMDVASAASGSRGGPRPQREEKLPAYASRKAREIEYKPYSLSDYKRIAAPTKLGSLGPDLASPELQAKQERRRRMQSYGAKLKQMHRSHIPAPIVPKGSVERREKVSKSERARQYSKTIRKPAHRGGAPAPHRASGVAYAGTSGFGGTFGHGVGAGARGGGYDLQTSQSSKYNRGAGNTPIEAMELKHRIDLQQVASIRESYM